MSQSEKKKRNDNHAVNTKVRNYDLVFVLRNPQCCEATEQVFRITAQIELTVFAWVLCVRAVAFGTCEHS